MNAPVWLRMPACVAKEASKYRVHVRHVQEYDLSWTEVLPWLGEVQSRIGSIAGQQCLYQLSILCK